MSDRVRAKKPSRTLLEHLIRERQLTFDEFTEYAEKFAREHGESGTLSTRHLQRLVCGRQSDGSLLGPVRPATARLLERIFGARIAELLRPPAEASAPIGTSLAKPDGAHVLRVAVAIVLNQSDVLMVCRRGSVGRENSWQFPAGMIKPGAPPEMVAMSETLAETSVQCVVRRSLGRRLHPSTKVFCDYLLCEYVSGVAKNFDPAENASVGWVNKAQVTRLIPRNDIFSPVLRALHLNEV